MLLTLGSRAIGTVVVGLLSGVERADGGDDVDPADRRDHLVEALLGLERALVDDRRDAVDALAVQQRDVVAAADATVRTHSVRPVALIFCSNIHF